MVYFFYGENTFSATQKINEIIQRYKDATVNSEFGLHRFNEDSDPEAVVVAMTMQPMFEKNGLVVMDGVGGNARLRDMVLNNIDRVPDNIVVIVHEREVDKRSRWFKHLSKTAKVTDFALKSEAQLIDWVIQQVLAHERTIDRVHARFLINWVGSDQWRLMNETEKLCAQKKIDEQTIRDLVAPSPKHTIFELLDALSRGNIDTALQYFDDLSAQNIHPLEVLTMLSWQMRNLIVVAASENRDDRTIAREHKINPFVVKKSRAITKNIPAATLGNAYAAVIETDIYMKTTHHLDDASAVEKLIVEIGSLYRAA